MRKFVINVNGKSYEVEVEEVNGGSVSERSNVSFNPAPAVSNPVSAPKKTEAPKAAPAGPISENAEKVKSPMPGTILDIKVQVGDTISKGQVLAILEAMKMENEIMSPRDGKVASIQITKGASTNAGDVLFAIE